MLSVWWFSSGSCLLTAWLLWLGLCCVLLFYVCCVDWCLCLDLTCEVLFLSLFLFGVGLNYCLIWLLVIDFAFMIYFGVKWLFRLPLVVCGLLMLWYVFALVI